MNVAPTSKAALPSGEASSMVVIHILLSNETAVGELRSVFGGRDRIIVVPTKNRGRFRDVMNGTVSFYSFP
jgi:hypothetical protein